MTDNVTIVDHPLVQHKLTLMRDKNTPTLVFRQLLHEISPFLFFEATRDLPVRMTGIDTPVAQMQAPVLAGRKPALISVLRAGNGLLDGVLKVIPTARVGFIGLRRDEVTLEPAEYCFKVPGALSERLTFVLDPMVATGNSAAAAIVRLKQAGAANIRLISLLAAPEGTTRLQQAHPEVQIVTAAIDARLNDNGFIVPGLGDAGDRLFGT